MTTAQKSAIRTVIVVVAMAVGCDLRAIWEKYSPFIEQPPRFPQESLRIVRKPGTSGEHLEFFRGSERSPRLFLELGEDGGSLRIAGASFETRVEAHIIADIYASAAELNGDFVPDYIFVSGSGGCGLAGQIRFTTFLLSSPNGYVARSVLSFDNGPTDLVDVNRDGHPEFLHCLFVYGAPGKDGRTHNYWVYNLLAFDGKKIVPANSASADFPKWILYTFHANHSDSDQLTQSQREELWRAAWNREPSHRLPDIETFAREQGRTMSQR